MLNIYVEIYVNKPLVKLGKKINTTLDSPLHHVILVRKGKLLGRKKKKEQVPHIIQNRFNVSLSYHIPRFLERVRLSVFYQQLQEWLLNRFGRGGYLLFVDNERDRLTKIQFIRLLKLKINKSEKETMGKKGSEPLGRPELALAKL